MNECFPRIKCLCKDKTRGCTKRKLLMRAKKANPIFIQQGSYRMLDNEKEMFQEIGSSAMTFVNI